MNLYNMPCRPIDIKDVRRTAFGHMRQNGNYRRTALMIGLMLALINVPVMLMDCLTTWNVDLGALDMSALAMINTRLLLFQAMIAVFISPALELGKTRYMISAMKSDAGSPTDLFDGLSRGSYFVSVRALLWKYLLMYGWMILPTTIAAQGVAMLQLGGGAGLATALGQVLAILILCSHFFSKKNGLKTVRFSAFFKKASAIFVAGFSVFVVDIAMGILAMLFNNQIMKYLDTSSLAVYGVIVNLSSLVQSLSYGVGQAAQPIVSKAYGAGRTEDIRRVQRYGIVSAFVVGLLALAAAEAFPSAIIRGFMKTDSVVESIAPRILRIYALSFVLLPRNIFFTYFYQAIMKPAGALTISLVRGICVSGLLIFILPLIFGGEALWWVMPVTELLTFALGLLLDRKYRLPAGGDKRGVAVEKAIKL